MSKFQHFFILELVFLFITTTSQAQTEVKDLINERRDQESSSQNSPFFFTNDFYVELTSQDNSLSAFMKPNNRGTFTRVILSHLSTSINPSQFTQTQEFQFDLKLHWDGFIESSSPDKPEYISDTYLVKGQVTRIPNQNEENNQLVIKILDIPDLYILGEFFPKYEMAQIFYRNVSKDAEINKLEIDVKNWIKNMITPVLTNYINSHKPDALEATPIH